MTIYNKTKEFVKSFFHFDIEIEELIKSQTKILKLYETTSASLTEEIIKLRKQLEPDEKANFWNDKWTKNKVIYQVQNNLQMDVRNLIINKSYFLEPKIKSYINKTDDEKALAILRLIKNKLTYISDTYKYGQPEYWQAPELTWQLKQGDCEDGSLLIISLLLILKVPSYKVKLCAGWVNNNGKKEGHAYVIYLTDDDKWYILDWCYYGNESIKNFKTLEHNKNNHYKEIWWTANDKFTWSQKNTVIK